MFNITEPYFVSEGTAVAKSDFTTRSFFSDSVVKDFSDSCGLVFLPTYNPNKGQPNKLTQRHGDAEKNDQGVSPFALKMFFYSATSVSPR
jgi:hypothetical protein